MRKQRSQNEGGDEEMNKEIFSPSTKKDPFWASLKHVLGMSSKERISCVQEEETKVTTQQFYFNDPSFLYAVLLKDPLLSCPSSEKLQVVTEDKCDQLTNC